MAAKERHGYGSRMSRAGMRQARPIGQVYG